MTGAPAVFFCLWKARALKREKFSSLIMEEKRFSELVLRYGMGQYVEPFAELEKKALELARRSNLEYVQMGQVMDEVKRKLLEKSVTPF